jgi:poly(3-hydroxybutyrate) depolymerase
MTLNSKSLNTQNISIPSCPAGAITPDCISPDFSPGGVGYIKNGNYDFNNRNFGVALPANYDATKPYPVLMEGGGCTGGPINNGGGFNAGEGANPIRVGLSYVGQCFADGGEYGGMQAGFGCAPSVATQGICVNTPEVPYIKAAIAWLEKTLCVDKGNIFIGGYSSGAWEASTMGCALANEIRGTVQTFGGLRVTRPACTGPVAALMVGGTADTDNPVGPLATKSAFLDSFGLAPERDEVLMRNGCQGMQTAMYDPAYPMCVKYTGCPAAYPVVWCLLQGVGHGGNNISAGGVQYVPGAAGNPLMWTFLSKLPPAP